jgi:hypothetical protein
VKQESATSEFGKFDAVMRKILSVSDDEVKKHEEKWKKRRKAKTRGRAK